MTSLSQSTIALLRKTQPSTEERSPSIRPSTTTSLTRSSTETTQPPREVPSSSRVYQQKELVPRMWRIADSNKIKHGGQPQSSWASEEPTSEGVGSPTTGRQSGRLTSPPSYQLWISSRATSKTGKLEISFSEWFVNKYYSDDGQMMNGFFLLLGLSSTANIEHCSFIWGRGSSGAAVFVDTFSHLTMRFSRIEHSRS